MRVLSIKIKNFLSVGKVSYKLKDQGLVLVKGENLDATSFHSNGAGKSNIFTDALVWCLFGITSRGLRADSVLSTKSKNNCSVKLQLRKDKKLVKIIRYRNHSKHGNGLSLHVAGEDVTQSRVSDTEKVLSDLIGIDRETFLYTTVLGQGLSYKFSDLTDAGRKGILEKISHVEEFEAARQLSMEKLSKKRDFLSELMGRFKSSKDSCADLEESLNSSLKLLEKEEEEKSGKREGLGLSIHNVVGEIKEIKEGVGSLKLELAELDFRINERTPPVKELEVSRKKARKNLNQAKGIKILKESEIKEVESLEPGSCPTCGSKVDGKHIEDLLERKKNELSLIKVDLKEVKKVFREVADSYEDAARTLSETFERKDKVERKIEEYENFSLRPLREHKKELERSIRDLDTESGLAKAVRGSERLIKKEKERLLELTRSIAGAKNEVNSLDFWVKGFGDIRSIALDGTLAFLNERLEHYCKTLTDGEIKVELSRNERGKIDLGISTPGESYASASGGEKDRIDISLAFALHDLATQSTGFNTNFLILDEIANFMDDAGIDRLMSLVAEKLDRVESVFVISRNPAFFGHCDRVFQVIKEGQVSRLETEAS